MIPKYLINKLILISLFCVFANASYSQDEMINLDTEKHWVDSVYNSLDLEQRIAQLLMIRANNAGQDYFKEIPDYVKKYNIGGITFFANTPQKQLQATNSWQKLAKTPLLISIDGENGVGMRLKGVYKFPYQITLGAIQNDSLLYQMGELVAQQCKDMGIQINFAPVVDINVNPKNPVINSRSFGENKENVARKGIMYMKGMQDNGIIAVAKHFPGHGDTDADSHYTLPIVNHSKTRLDSIELYPFKQMIDQGLQGVMVAHLYLPALVKKENTATTLSPVIVNDLLKKEMGFKGLAMTDALDMQGVTKYFKPGIIEQKALLAGNDILVLPQDVPKAIRKLKKAVEKGEIPANIIEEKCKKILLAKYRAGLSKRTDHPSIDIITKLNNPKSSCLIRKMYEEAFTIVKNSNDLLPIKDLDSLKIASLTIGNLNYGAFQKRTDLYASVDHFYWKEKSKINNQDLLNKLAGYDLVLISVQNTSIHATRRFGISEESMKFINSVIDLKPSILNLHANPYALDFFADHPNLKSILVSYEDKSMVHDLSAQVLFGGIPVKGKLPVTVNERHPVNTGLTTEKIRLEYTTPTELNINPKDLEVIDSIALDGVSIKAFPGCQIMAIKDGKVFYHKSFGKHTYKTNNAVKNSDIYDIASITKVAATTIALMKLQEDGWIDMDDKLSKFVPFLKGSNKEDVNLRELMTHQARFKAWIPYYRATIEGRKKLEGIYSTKISEDFPVRVAENLYISSDYEYVIMDSIMDSELREKNDYKYSDLGFYLVARMIDNVTNQSISDYCIDNFYDKLGLRRTSYFPRKKFSLTEIIPTEDDKEFRLQLVHGDVHDPGAAMLGGMSGHAGLFSNANDLAIIMQMILNGGTYGGHKFLNQSTIKEFTNYQYPLNDNRRGIGFDKPLLEYEEDAATCVSATPSSYGHSGFTGTYVWVDPAYDFIYVFLSNRVHPDASNSKIMKLNIRTNIHEAFYEAIRNAKNY